MTVTEDFISDNNGQKRKPTAPVYPTAFGITLTPVVSGILFAVLGVAGALYLILNSVMPALQKSEELQERRDQKQALVGQKEASLRRQNKKVKVDLHEAKQQKAQVLTLFANEKTLDTLLLDLNRVIESANARVQGNDVRAELKRFLPVNQSASVITDGSLGPEVNGKLKRRIINVEIEGTFAQTQAILRGIERLQPLLIVRDYQSTLVQANSDEQRRVLRSPAIATSFHLQALIPASPEEVAKATASANQPQRK